MVVKRCPKCSEALPVACKSCPCGHVFISKKLQDKPTAEGTETEQQLNTNNVREKRLRPERPRREIPDFDYSYSAMSANITAAETSAESAGIYCPREETTDNNTVYVKTEQGLQLPDGTILRRKRGRPKGSKNKPKSLLPDLSSPKSDTSQNSGCQGFEPGKRKRGRPKGSKNRPKPMLNCQKANKNLTNEDGGSDTQQGGSPAGKQERVVDVMPVVSREKAIMYSTILSDINQKFMAQIPMKIV